MFAFTYIKNDLIFGKVLRYNLSSHNYKIFKSNSSWEIYCM
jgi:hypothetical protein